LHSDSTSRPQKRKPRSPYDPKYCAICGVEILWLPNTIISSTVMHQGLNEPVDYSGSASAYSCSAECARAMMLIPPCELLVDAM
jgi:hypothetical protein